MGYMNDLPDEYIQLHQDELYQTTLVPTQTFLILLIKLLLTISTQLHRSPKHRTLSPIIRQLSSQDDPWIPSQIGPVIPHRLIRKLIDIEIDISIESHVRGIRPDDPTLIGLLLLKKGMDEHTEDL